MNASVSLPLWVFLLSLWLAGAFGFSVGFLWAALCRLNKESGRC
ncbi:hypothetical protein [Ancylobacter pratisalsi]|nr:hypothetical protein [Ancylobacter pratisalsi]